MAGILTRVQSILFGGAIGAASSDAIRPVLEPVRQHAWQSNQHKVVEPGTAGELAAKAIITAGEAHDEASRNGFSPNRADALIQLAQSYPGTADLAEGANRQLLDPSQVSLALARHGIPEQYHDALIAMFQRLLSPADIASGVQQGHLPNDGILPEVSPAVTPAQGMAQTTAPDQQPPSHVPLTQVDIDPIAEAAGSGVSEDRLKVMANLAGLPPGAESLLDMWNRNLIDEASVDAGIREGHLKTKWAAAFKRLRWSVLHATEYANLYLRGWITQEQMYEGGGLTGFTTDQMDLMYLNRGRPMSPTQAATAWARKAPHPEGLGYVERPGTFDEEDFLRAIKQSDVRTEYGPLLWHNRYAYPSLFQLAKLAASGAIGRDRMEVILGYERYEPQDIEAMLDSWYSASAATATPTRQKSAQTAAIAAGKKQYLRGKLAIVDAVSYLEGLGLGAAEAQTIVDYWQQEADVTEKLLTPSQLKKAYGGNLITRDEALEGLVAQHFSVDDANTFLNI